MSDQEMSYTSNEMLNALFGSQTIPTVVLRDFSGPRSGLPLKNPETCMSVK